MVVPYIAQKRLNILCYWVSRRHRLNESIEAGPFDQVALNTYSQLYVFETEEEDATASTVQAPSEYKTGSKWKPFKESAIAYFNSIKGTHNIPLTYVIREQENPDPNAVYQSDSRILCKYNSWMLIFTNWQWRQTVYIAWRHHWLVEHRRGSKTAIFYKSHIMEIYTDDAPLKDGNCELVGRTAQHPGNTSRT